MKEDIEKLNKEREELVKNLQILEQKRNEIVIRLTEIQGVLKYLEEKQKENKK